MTVRAAALISTALFLVLPAFADVVPPKAEDAPVTLFEDETTAIPMPEAIVPEQKVEEILEQSPIDKIASTLVLRDGTHELAGGKARVVVAEGFSFLDEADARKLLTEVWGNPPDAAANVLGAIVPSDVSVTTNEGWAAIITYEDDGHVADDDAKSIDYKQLMTEMKEETAGENEARKKANYEPITLVGWAQEPRYDVAEHKLYWAKHLKFGSESDTLNYAIRALGREGVLQINVVSGIEQLKAVNTKVPGLLSMVSFTDGNRYADYKEGDKLAAYGLAGLIAGGVAAKAGLFKLLLASWKFIAIGVIALGGIVWRIFSSRKADGPAAGGD